MWPAGRVLETHVFTIKKTCLTTLVVAEHAPYFVVDCK